MSVRIVMPCFNEADRFDVSSGHELLVDSDVELILVDDGSTDDTLEVLKGFALDYVGRVDVIHLANNVGKAEAVRIGMQAAIKQRAEIIGYLDADFATPALEMLRLVDVLRQTAEAKVLLGSRWLHLGADIQRQPLRHYGGRVFATLASMVLNLKVYDTQCGAKLFRSDSVLVDALEDGFVSRWAFDVELIGRLRQSYPVANFLEVPLNRWIDVAGSKITFFDMVKATIALLSIRRALVAFGLRRSG